MRPIDADALNELMKQSYCRKCSGRYPSMCHACWVMSMMDEVDVAPTINPEDLRPEGKWDAPVGHGLPFKANRLGVVCSNCCSWCDNKYGYCPNCGARMEE